MGLGPISIPPPVDLGASSSAGPGEPRPPQGPSDLPSPAAGLRASDFPAPLELPGVELPRPGGDRPVSARGLDDLDLPGVIGRPIGEDEIELASRAPNAKASGESDLPAVFDRSASDVDLPAPVAPRGSLGDVDLPSPVARRSDADDLDLPAPASARGFDPDLDLPAPVGSSGFAADLDLPRPAEPSGAGMDLPAPRGLSGFGEEVDLPMRSSDAQLPAPSAGSVGLPAPSESAEELPILREDVPEGELEIEAFERKHGEGPIELEMESEGLSLELLDGPSGPPQAPAPPVPPISPLGFGADAAEAGMPGSSSDDAPVVPGAKPSRIPAERAKRKAKKIALPPWFARAAVTTAALGLLVGAGFYLGGTKYGLFGVHLLEPYLPSSGSPAEVARAIELAEELFAEDTFGSSQAAIDQLTELQSSLALSRELAARRLMHESLFQHRFGPDASSQQRITELQGFLSARGNQAPGLELAQAAVALRNGDFATASAQLAQASASSDADPYLDILSGEVALAQAQAEPALAAFQRALEKAPSARAHWGISRAYGLLGDVENQLAAARETLAESPEHGSAPVVVARALLADGKGEQALELLHGPAGLKASGVAPASIGERSEALTVLAEIEERRGRRGVARETYEKAAQMDPRNVEAALGAARLILDEGSYQEAFTRFQALINAGVTGSTATHASGQPKQLVEAKLGAVRALLLMGKAKEAQALLLDLQTEEPIDPELELWHGKVAEGLGDGDAAVQHFRNATKLDPEHFPAYVALSQYFASKGKPNEAIRVLVAAEKHVEMTAEVHRVRGQAELARNRVEDAIVQFKKALKKQPLDASSEFGLVVAYRRLGRLDEAKAALDKAEQIDAAFPGLALEKGLIAEARGDVETAATSYRAALELTPGDMALKSRLGAVLTMTGQLDEAQNLLADVLRSQPYSAEAEHYLGRIALLRGDKAQARQHFLRAARLEPQNGSYRMYVGWAALEANEFASALRNFKAAIRIDPSLGDAYWLRGRIELRTGAVRDAATDFEKALKLNPDRIEAYGALAEAYDQLGKRRKAIEAYSKGVEAAPQNASWWYRLGRLQLDQGEEAAAIASLGKAITLAEDGDAELGWVPDAHRLLGDAHRSSGDDENAILSYQRYLEIAPANAVDRDFVEGLLRRLKP